MNAKMLKEFIALLPDDAEFIFFDECVGLKVGENHYELQDSGVILMEPTYERGYPQYHRVERIDNLDVMREEFTL